VCQLLTVLLRRRVGELPESVQTGLRNAPVKQLETWSLLLLEAVSLKEVGVCIEMMQAAGS
jgi:hypothetical protein